MGEIRDYVKRSNLQLTGIPEGEEEKTSNLENIFEDIIHENFPILVERSTYRRRNPEKSCEILDKMPIPKAHSH